MLLGGAGEFDIRAAGRDIADDTRDFCCGFVAAGNSAENHLVTNAFTPVQHCPTLFCGGTLALRGSFETGVAARQHFNVNQ